MLSPAYMVRSVPVTAGGRFGTVVMVKAAKRGGGGMRGVGAAALMMFSWATMRSPANNPVAEAQDGRIRKGTHSGDPLKPEEKS